MSATVCDRAVAAMEGVVGEIDLDKRFYIPGIILRDTCPHCQAPYVRDFSDHYLSYPTTGKPVELTGYCGECEGEWPIGTVTVRVSLEFSPHTE